MFVALADRLTIADIAIVPFANERVAASAAIDFNEWPALKSWSERILNLPEVVKSQQRATRFGHK